MAEQSLNTNQVIEFFGKLMPHYDVLCLVVLPASPAALYQNFLVGGHTAAFWEKGREFCSGYGHL